MWFREFGIQGLRFRALGFAGDFDGRARPSVSVATEGCDELFSPEQAPQRTERFRCRNIGFGDSL